MILIAGSVIVKLFIYLTDENSLKIIFQYYVWSNFPVPLTTKCELKLICSYFLSAINQITVYFPKPFYINDDLLYIMWEKKIHKYIFYPVLVSIYVCVCVKSYINIYNHIQII